MKNQKKIFQKLFRNVPWQPAHADIKDTNLQIQVSHLDDLFADDGSEQLEPHFPKYVKQEDDRRTNAFTGTFARRDMSKLTEMVNSKRNKTRALYK